MLRTSAFTLRVAQEDKKMFRELARRLQRSQADAIRIAVRETLAGLQSEETKKSKPELIGATQ